MISMLGAPVKPWMLVLVGLALAAGLLLLFLGTRRRPVEEDPVRAVEPESEPTEPANCTESTQTDSSEVGSLPRAESTAPGEGQPVAGGKLTEPIKAPESDSPETPVDER